MGNLLVFLALLLVGQPADSATLFGSVDAIYGEAYWSDQAGESGSISTGQKIYTGQTINTASNGEVHLVTEDGGLIAVRPDSVFRVDEYAAEGGTADKIFMSLFKGAIRSITGWIGKHNTSAYLITTPSATIGVRGTDHETTVIERSDGDEAGTYDTVNEGATLLKTAQGETEVGPGKSAFASRDRATAPVLLSHSPHFLATRRLKIEQRIRQRKAYLHDHLEQLREERRSHLESGRGDAGEQGHRHVVERHNALREKRLEQARQRREARQRETARQREARRAQAGQTRHKPEK